MAIRLFKPEPAHAPVLAEICFTAFAALQDWHCVERDFDVPEMARGVIGMLCSRPDYFGVAAERDGVLLGSNFLQLTDPVAAVGPITVRADAQAAGVGRALMEAVLAEAQRRGVTQVRLLQEAINTTSLSLYTKLGFDWQDACALMRPAPAAADHPAIRPMTTTDLPAVDRVSSRHYHSTRKGEVSGFIAAGLPAFVLERAGDVTGYLLPGFFGHGFASTSADLAALIGHAMRHVQPPFTKFLVPLSQSELHRALLLSGGRTVKLFNYMTIGEYRRPTGAWVPSIGC